MVELENDKPTVLALREIAENLVNSDFMAAQDEADTTGRCRRSGTRRNA